MSTGAPDESTMTWLSIEAVRGAAERLAAGGVADPSPGDVAAALGVQEDVVLAVLAARSGARIQQAQAAADTADQRDHRSSRSS